MQLVDQGRSMTLDLQRSLAACLNALAAVGELQAGCMLPDQCRLDQFSNALHDVYAAASGAWSR